MRVHKSTSFAVIVAALAISAAGCSSDSKTTAQKIENSVSSISGQVTKPESKGNPCTLISKADVESEIGGTVSAGEETERNCEYKVTGTTKFGTVNDIASLTVLARFDPITDEATFDITQKALKGEELSGVGDAAYSTDLGGAIVAFFQDGTSVTIQTVSVGSVDIDKADLLDPTIALAKTAAGNL